MSLFSLWKNITYAAINPVPKSCIYNLNSRKKIIVGPTLDYDRIINPLLKLFYSRGIDMSKIEIEKSNIPYRGWGYVNKLVFYMIFFIAKIFITSGQCVLMFKV